MMICTFCIVDGFECAFLKSLDQHQSLYHSHTFFCQIQLCTMKCQGNIHNFSFAFLAQHQNLEEKPVFTCKCFFVQAETNFKKYFVLLPLSYTQQPCSRGQYSQDHNFSTVAVIFKTLVHSSEELLCRCLFICLVGGGLFDCLIFILLLFSFCYGRHIPGAFD